jgi:hypothetical protein
MDTGIFGGIATTPPPPPDTYCGYPAYGYPPYTQSGCGYPGHSGYPLAPVLRGVDTRPQVRRCRDTEATEDIPLSPLPRAMNIRAPLYSPASGSSYAYPRRAIPTIRFGRLLNGVGHGIEPSN